MVEEEVGVRRFMGDLRANTTGQPAKEEGDCWASS